MKTKEIYRIDLDGEPDYDGEEEMYTTPKKKTGLHGRLVLGIGKLKTTIMNSILNSNERICFK